MKVINKIASVLAAYKNCEKSDNKEWLEKHYQELKNLTFEYLPSGGGFDGHMEIDLEESTPDKIVIYYEFHFMDEEGYYTHWSDFTSTVTPSFVWGVNIQTTGSSDLDEVEYVEERLHYELTREV